MGRGEDRSKEGREKRTKKLRGMGDKGKRRQRKAGGKGNGKRRAGDQVGNRVGGKEARGKGEEGNITRLVDLKLNLLTKHSSL